MTMKAKYAPPKLVAGSYGIPVSTQYEMAGRNPPEIRFVKLGGKTLVDLEHLDAMMAALPEAKIAPPKARGKAAGKIA